MDMEYCNFVSSVTQTPSSDECSEEDTDHLSVLDFQFLDSDNTVPLDYYSSFDIVEEINEEPAEEEIYDDETSMLRDAMKRMKYERKFSASLYAFNGIPECLKLKLESENEMGRGNISNQINNLKMACSKNKN